jgi:hypothetical protein
MSCNLAFIFYRPIICNIAMVTNCIVKQICIILNSIETNIIANTTVHFLKRKRNLKLNSLAKHIRNKIWYQVMSCNLAFIFYRPIICNIAIYIAQSDNSYQRVLHFAVTEANNITYIETNIIANTTVHFLKRKRNLKLNSLAKHIR